MLYGQQHPLRLREIQALSNLEINPVNVAVHDLRKERYLRAITKEGVMGFILNVKHPSYRSLSAVLSTMEQNALTERKERLEKSIRESADVWMRLLESSKMIRKAG